MSNPFQNVYSNPASAPPAPEKSRSGIPAIPAKIATAIIEVMGSVPRLARDEKNVHAGYQFASIDDFLEAVRPLCAGAGLIILQDEVEHEVVDGGAGRDGKPRRWLRVTYAFTLAHASGETWEHRPTRSVTVDASMGAQAFGSAQSYTLKLFMRSLFQISTGEKGQDVDAQPPNPLPSKQDKKAAFIASCRKIIDQHTDINKLRDWWNSDAEKAMRRLHDLTQPEVQSLIGMVNQRRAGIETLAEQSGPAAPQGKSPRRSLAEPPAPTANHTGDEPHPAQYIIDSLDRMNVEADIKDYMEANDVWEALEAGAYSRPHAQAIETAFRAAIERAQPEDDEPPPPPA